MFSFLDTKHSVHNIVHNTRQNFGDLKCASCETHAKASTDAYCRHLRHRPESRSHEADTSIQTVEQVLNNLESSRQILRIYFASRIYKDIKCSGDNSIEIHLDLLVASVSARSLLA